MTIDDPTAITITPDVTNNAMVLSGRVTLQFVTQDDESVYRARSISFVKVPLELVPDPFAQGEFRFEPRSVSGVTIDDASTAPDPSLIFTFYHGDTAKYIEEETAVLLVGAPTIVEKFASMIPFPRLRQAMRTFVLGEDVNANFTSEYLVVSAPPVLQAKTCGYSPTPSSFQNQDSPSNAPDT
jgi:hypothetical protein